MWLPLNLFFLFNSPRQTFSGLDALTTISAYQIIGGKGAWCLPRTPLSTSLSISQIGVRSFWDATWFPCGFFARTHVFCETHVKSSTNHSDDLNRSGDLSSTRHRRPDTLSMMTPCGLLFDPSCLDCPWYFHWLYAPCIFGSVAFAMERIACVGVRARLNFSLALWKLSTHLFGGWAESTQLLNRWNISAHLLHHRALTKNSFCLGAKRKKKFRASAGSFDYQIAANGNRYIYSSTLCSANKCAHGPTVSTICCRSGSASWWGNSNCIPEWSIFFKGFDIGRVLFK